MFKTYSAKPDEIPREWLLIDVAGKPVGRAASEIAKILRGKNKPQFTPHVDTGDFVIAVNAEKVVLTGGKLQSKHYHHHTGFVGGIKSIRADKMLQDKPTEVLRLAVKGMLPKNSLGRQLLKKLKIYAATDHPHGAQQPKVTEI